MRIFVANIAFTTTEEELRALFASYGIVDRTQIVTDRDTGRSRGFDFVEMPDTTEAQATIDGLHGTSLGDARGQSMRHAHGRSAARETMGIDADAHGGKCKAAVT